jgi:hypothetical protein
MEDKIIKTMYGTREYESLIEVKGENLVRKRRAFLGLDKADGNESE